LIGIVLALVTLPAIANAQDKSFVWQRIESDVTVQQDGWLHVRETLTLRYGGGPFTFAYRDMPIDYLESISNIMVRDAERVYTPTDDESTTPFTFFVGNDERGQRVRWVYPPTEHTTRTFTLQYDVTGAVTRDGDKAALRWPIVFAERDEVVEAATGRVRVPAGVSSDQIVATFANEQGTIETSANEAVAQVRDVPPGEDVYMEVQFPGSAVTSAQPAWRAAELAQAQYDATLRPVVDLALSLVTAVAAAVLTWSLARWWRSSRDPQPQFVAATDAYFPPDQLQPALAARLLGNNGAALQSTLFDLANRGYVRFAQRDEKNWWNTHPIMAVYTGKPVHDLEQFERAALEALFGNEERVELSKRHSALVGASSTIKEYHTKALIERGYLTPEGLARRQHGLAIGGVLLGIGMVALVPAIIFAARYSWLLVALAGAVTLLGFLWLLMAAVVHGLSQRGADAAQQWRSFGAYIAGLQPATAPPDQFSRLLPFATVLGPGTAKLTKAYKQSAEPLPAWYQPTNAGDTLAASAATVLLLRDWDRQWDGFHASFVASSGASGGGGSGGGGGGGSGGGGAG